jgi:lipoprotein-releasing system permease protein
MSRLPFELLLALRYLRPKRTFVSIITLISVLGVTLGVAVLIIVISVMSGFDRDLRDKVFGFNAHLTILEGNPTTGRQIPMTNYPDVIKIVDGNPQVRGSSPFVQWQVVLETEPESGGSQIAAPFLRGVDAKAESDLGLIVTNIVSGVFDLSGRGILVGTDFAEQYYLNVGDRILLSSPSDIKKMRDSHGATNEEIIPPADYEIRGIFNTGFYEYNSTVVITSLENAQDLTGLGDAVQGIKVMLHDPFAAARASSQLEKTLGKNYVVKTWEQENTGMMAVMVEKDVMFYILFFIVIVAAFGITCTLITFVVLKTREIGVMKALGATSRQVMWIFLAQSLVVSFLGVVIGTGLGVLAVTYRNPFLHAMRYLTGLELFPAKIYYFTDLPAQIVPGDILVICGGSLVICLLAAAFPAWNASRLKPVEALRHE